MNRSPHILVLLSLLAFLSGPLAAALPADSYDGAATEATSAPCHGGMEHQASGSEPEAQPGQCHLMDGGLCQCAAASAVPVQLAYSLVRLIPPGPDASPLRALQPGVSDLPLRPPSA